MLLVSLTRFADEPAREPEVQDDGASPPAPAPLDIGPSGRTAGDDLFTEQGDTLHLPEGTTALVPTIPTFGGTGGSTSVLAAEDGPAATQALLDEALATDGDGETGGPEVSRADDGTEVVTADFNISAGGWGFDVVAVQGPGDEAATMYVTSNAD